MLYIFELVIGVLKLQTVHLFLYHIMCIIGEFARRQHSAALSIAVEEAGVGRDFQPPSRFRLHR